MMDSLTKLQIICWFLIEIQLIITETVDQRGLRPPDLCSNLSIETASRVSADTKFMLIFKDSFYWILDLANSKLAASPSPIQKLAPGNAISYLNASWIDIGFDQTSPKSGQIKLLMGTKITWLNISYSGQLSVARSGDFPLQNYWSDANGFIGVNPIEDIEQLNTIDGKLIAGLRSKSQDLLALSANLYAGLWSLSFVFSNQTKYETKQKIEPRIEKGKNELTFLKPEARFADWWTGKDWQPVSSLIDITALVYYPLSDDVFVFGKGTTYCKVNLKKDLICKHRPLKTLFGCDSQQQSGKNTDSSSDGIPVTEDNESQSEEMRKTTANHIGNGQPSTSNKGIFFMVLAIVILVLIVAVVATVVCLLLRNKTTTKSSVKDSKEQINVGTIDPRYGQLDSNVNLSMKIAEPSYADLDKQMTAQDRAKAAQSDKPSSNSESKRSQNSS